MSEAEADQVLTAAQSLALGDSYYVDENYTEALDAYAVTIAICSSNSSSDQSSKTSLFRSLSHKAAALMKLERYDEAVTDSRAALENDVGGLRPGETQACHHLLGVALFQLNRVAEAHISFSQAAQLATLNGRDATKHEVCKAKCEERLDLDQQEAAAISVVAEAQKPAEEDEDDMLIVEEIQQKAPPLRKVAAKPPTMPKYQYYQNDSFMKIEILEPNLDASLVKVTFAPKKLTVIVTKSGTDFTVICGKIFDKVNVDKCKVVYKEEKVLIKLRKTSPHDWHELFSKALNDDKDDDEEMPSADEILDGKKVPTVQSGTPRPYASNRDWNAIERNLETAEKLEKPVGDEAMNALFQQIYAKADEDTKRAMIKSYQTSGGTVLSTNWDEVKEKNYEEELVAPQGMEWKTWEGDKVKSTNDETKK